MRQGNVYRQQQNKRNTAKCDNSTSRGEKGRATEFRRNELIRVWMVIELYRLEGHHFVSLSFKEEMRECDKAKGVYTVLEARRQCENEIRRRGQMQGGNAKMRHQEGKRLFQSAKVPSLWSSQKSLLYDMSPTRDDDLVKS